MTLLMIYKIYKPVSLHMFFVDRLQYYMYVRCPITTYKKPCNLISKATKHTLTSFDVGRLRCFDRLTCLVSAIVDLD